MQIADILENSKNDCVYVVDVYGEYRHLTEKLHGEVIEPSFSPVMPTYLNPLDIDLRYNHGLFHGKSSEMVSALLRDSNIRVYIIDPEAEYVALSKSIRGEVVEIKADTQDFINPMDIDIDYVGEADPISMKADYVVSMLELMLGRGQKLDPQTRAVITRCVRLTYKPYVKHLEQLQAKDPVITCDKDSMPTLETLYDELRKQPEPEAQTAADMLENYVKGTFAMFSHRSDIKAGSRFLVYSCRMFSQGLKEIVMFACLNDIWNRMLENDRNGLRTWVYIENIDLIAGHTLFNMNVLAQAHRCNIIGISGVNMDDVLMKKMVDVVMPSGFVSIMAIDRSSGKILKECLGLTEAQGKHIAPDIPPGHGLFCTKEGIQVLDSVSAACS